MSDTTNDNDIEALLDYLDAQCLPGYRKALTALVAERNALKQENEAQSYDGNSASHWAASSKVYGDCISNCWKVLMLAGFPPNGNIDIVAALTALVAERDELKEKHAHLGQSYTMLAKECDALKARVEDMKAINSTAVKIISERDALREQLRLANIDQFNTEAEANDRDRELRERLVCAALTGACSLEGWVRLEDLANHAVGAAEATLAAMRKGDGDGK